MTSTLALWLVVTGLVVGFLLLDVLVFHREPSEMGVAEASAWSVVWLVLGMAFSTVVWWADGGVAATEYVTGYLIERTLSLDNLFVLAVILGYFAVPDLLRHRALLWGVAGALVFRALFIAVGAVALERFAWIAYVLGGFLVLSGVRLLRREIEVNPERNPVLAVVQRVVPMTLRYHGKRLLVRRDGRLHATPLLAVLVAVATTDAAFAADSIPAIYAVTDDPFLVFAANAFSVLGLLAMYFLLAALIARFRYLRPALATILVFVGLKMAGRDLYDIPIDVSLAVIVAVVGLAVAASAFRSRRPGGETDVPPHPRRRRRLAGGIRRARAGAPAAGQGRLAHGSRGVAGAPRRPRRPGGAAGRS